MPAYNPAVSVMNDTYGPMELLLGCCCMVNLHYGTITSPAGCHNYKGNQQQSPQ